MFLFVSSIAVAMGVSFLCSVMEAALLSLTPGKIADISRRKPAIGQLCRNFKQDIEKPIAVILILNTAAHTFGAAIAGAQFDKLYGSDWIWAFSLVFTILMVQYTEILPKTLGVRFNAPIICATARTLGFLVTVMAPVIALVHFINRPFDSGAKGGNDANALDEIGALAAVARRAEQITMTQEQILHNTPTLGTRPIGEVMLPLEKVCVIPDNLSRQELLEKISPQRHSRYPVSKAQTGEIVGSIDAKDLLFDDGPWQKLVRPISFVGIDIPQLELIENVVKLDSKLLIVKRDGHAVGMLTVTDALMELLGKDLPHTPAA